MGAPPGATAAPLSSAPAVVLVRLHFRAGVGPAAAAAAGAAAEHDEAVHDGATELDRQTADINEAPHVVEEWRRPR